MIKRARWNQEYLAHLVPTSVRVMLLELGADPCWWLGSQRDEALLAGSSLVSGVLVAPDPKRRILLHFHAYKIPAVTASSSFYSDRLTEQENRGRCAFSAQTTIRPSRRQGLVQNHGRREINGL